MDGKTATFEDHRAQLEGLAYRMLGTLDEAQDVVQDTWLRWRTADEREVRDPRAWLVTVCTRLAMDALRSAHRSRTSYTGPWLPEPFEVRTGAPSTDAGEIDETVSIALLLALERLTPPERAAFLLHDVFGYSFAEIAAILDKTPAACRQLASRARGHVEAGRPRFTASAQEHERLLEAFFAAARAGDVERLQRCIAESVEFHSDGGGKAQALPEVLRGREAVCAFFARVLGAERPAGREPRVASARFNGAPGLLLYEDGQLATALALRVEDGRIRQVFAHRNPDKLAAFGRRAAP